MTSSSSSALITSSSFSSLSNTSSSSTNSDAMDLSTIISLLLLHNVLTKSFEEIRKCINQKKCIACHGFIKTQDKVSCTFKEILFFVHKNCAEGAGGILNNLNQSGVIALIKKSLSQ